MCPLVESRCNASGNPATREMNGPLTGRWDGVEERLFNGGPVDIRTVNDGITLIPGSDDSKIDS